MAYKDKEKQKEQSKQYYQARRAEKIEKVKQYNHLHKVVRTEHYWQYRTQLKLEVLTHYGNGKCACVQCGFDDILALSIDHINGNGNEHRRVLGTTGGRPFYVWLKKNNYPEGYRTLCMNCQYIKRFKNKEYRKEAN